MLEAALGEKLALSARKLSSIEAFVERLPGVKRVMVDGTERPIQRPQDAAAPKRHYSGTKKRQTRKHLAAVDQVKRVLVLSKAREGKLHAKQFHAEADLSDSVPAALSVEVDWGFLGVQKQYDHIRSPHKKPRGEH